MPTLPSHHGCGRPFDKVVHIAPLLPVEEAECSAGTASAPVVCDDVNIAARHKEIARPCLNEACWRAQILDLPGIGRRSHEDRIPARLRRTMHVRKKMDTIAHRNGHVIILRHRVRRLGQISIIAPGGLRAIQTPLSRLDSRCFDSGHRLLLP